MSFVNPQFFWAMFIPLAIFTYLILTHKDSFLQIFDEKVLERLSAGDDSLPLVIRNLVMILAIFLMIVLEFLIFQNQIFLLPVLMTETGKIMSDIQHSLIGHPWVCTAPGTAVSSSESNTALPSFEVIRVC